MTAPSPVPEPVTTWVRCDECQSHHACDLDHGPDGHGGSSLCCPVKRARHKREAEERRAADAGLSPVELLVAHAIADNAHLLANQAAKNVVERLRQALQGPQAREVAEGLGMGVVGCGYENVNGYLVWFDTLRPERTCSLVDRVAEALNNSWPLDSPAEGAELSRRAVEEWFGPLFHLPRKEG